MTLIFKDREMAGLQLANALAEYRGRRDLIVLALPRGGVPVAHQVAEALDAPLDVLIVRKLGVPWHGELAMGAIASGGVQVLNEDVVRSTGVTEAQLKAVLERERTELARRERRYRGNRPNPDLADKTLILVDDGLATGATMRAAVEAVRQRGAGRVVVAVPVAPGDTMRRLGALADDVVCLSSPEPFYAIGQWYARFDQTTDEEVCDLLRRNWVRHSSSEATAGGTGNPIPGTSPQDTEAAPYERPIPQSEWKAFCESFSQEHRGWLVTLGEVDSSVLKLGPGEGRRAMKVLARNEPLRGIGFEPSPRQFEVETGMPGESRERHPIPNPLRLVEERQIQGIRGLRIDRNDGQSNLIEFRVAAREEALDGVAADEMS